MNLHLIFKYSSTMFMILLFSSTNLTYAKCLVQNGEEFLNSIKNNHPLIITGKNDVNTFKQEILLAKQRPNPEIVLDGVRGEELDGDFKKIGVSFMHTIELGGKRSSRVQRAKQKLRYYRLVTQNNKEEVIINSVIKLYRLSHIKELIPIYEEAYETLLTILSIKKQQKTLSPEELVEKETLVLATNDYKLKLSRLKKEEKKINQHLSFYLGENCRIKSDVFPKKLSFSQNVSSSSNIESYSKLQAAIENYKLKKSELKVQKSLRFPNLKIGPSIEFEEVNGKRYQSFGLTINFDLPVLSTNYGGIGRADSEVSNAEIKQKLIRREGIIDRMAWYDQYQEYKRSLLSIANRDELNDKHTRIEKLFKRGIISTALVIESHRQLIEFAKTLFEFELGAVEALWNIYKIDGTIMDQKIED